MNYLLRPKTSLTLALLAAIFLSTGCVRIAANLIHAIKGNDVPAEFNGLEGKKVAVVCSTDDGINANANGILLARYIQALLQQKVEKISLVSQEEIDQWIVGQGGSESNFADIGRGVKADYVIAIDMVNFSLREGATMYRGKCDLSVAVHDMAKEGKVTFRKNVGQYTFPTMAGASALETDETKFRKIYLSRVAERAARHFFPYEAGADVAVDAEMLAY